VRAIGVQIVSGVFVAFLSGSQVSQDTSNSGRLWMVALPFSKVRLRELSCCLINGWNSNYWYFNYAFLKCLNARTSEP
jgi:hypothetical protein